MTYNTLSEKTLDDKPPSVFKVICFAVLVIFAGVLIAFLNADPASYALTSYQKCEGRAESLRSENDKQFYLKNVCDTLPYEKNDRR